MWQSLILGAGYLITHAAAALTESQCFTQYIPPDGGSCQGLSGKYSCPTDNRAPCWFDEPFGAKLAPGQGCYNGCGITALIAVLRKLNIPDDFRNNPYGFIEAFLSEVTGAATACLSGGPFDCLAKVSTRISAGGLTTAVSGAVKAKVATAAYAKFTFDGACCGHDFCSTYSPQVFTTECNDAFIKDMTDACADALYPDVCKGLASLYYKAVAGPGVPFIKLDFAPDLLSWIQDNCQADPERMTTFHKLLSYLDVTQFADSLTKVPLIPVDTLLALAQTQIANNVITPALELANQYSAAADAMDLRVYTELLCFNIYTKLKKGKSSSRRRLATSTGAFTDFAVEVSPAYDSASGHVTLSLALSLTVTSTLDIADLLTASSPLVDLYSLTSLFDSSAAGSGATITVSVDSADVPLSFTLTIAVSLDADLTVRAAGSAQAIDSAVIR